MAEFENEFKEISVGFFCIAALFMLFSFIMESEVIDAIFLMFIISVPIIYSHSLLISIEDKKYISKSLNDRIRLSGFILIAITWYSVYSATDLSRGITFIVYLSFYTYVIDVLVIIFHSSLNDSRITKRQLDFLKHLSLLITAFFSSILPVAQVLLPAVLLLFALATYPIISVLSGIVYYFISYINNKSYI